MNVILRRIGLPLNPVNVTPSSQNFQLILTACDFTEAFKLENILPEQVLGVSIKRNVDINRIQLYLKRHSCTDEVIVH